jgi:hypothetical protein
MTEILGPNFPVNAAPNFFLEHEWIIGIYFLLHSSIILIIISS